jgi:hypothetical protein
MRTTSRFDGIEEFTCLIVAWKSNIYDTGGFVQRFAIDNSYVSLNSFIEPS